jgi:hypothetical protein
MNVQIGGAVHSEGDAYQDQAQPSTPIKTYVEGLGLTLTER